MRPPALRSSAVLLCAVLALAPAPLPADEGAAEAADQAVERYHLRYVFTPGQTVHYELSNESTIVTSKGELTETTVHESTARKHYRVVAADEAAQTGTLEMMIDSVKMSVQFGDSEPMSVDSRDPGNCHPAYRGVLATIGKPLARITVAGNGKFLKAERLLSPELQEAVTPPGSNSAGDSDDTNKNFLLVFPEEPLAVGESWKDEFEVPVALTRTLSQNVTLRRTYTLESVRDGRATIRQKTAVITPVREPTVLAQLVQRTPEGTIVFDLKRGMIVSRRLTVNKTEIGALGPDSSLRAVSTWTERLLTPEAVADAAAREGGRKAE